MENKTLRERITLGILIATFATAAYAAEHGAAAGTGYGNDRASACSYAKRNADIYVPYGATITGHSACDCSATGSSWTCTVDAYWEKK